MYISLGANNNIQDSYTYIRCAITWIYKVFYTIFLKSCITSNRISYSSIILDILPKRNILLLLNLQFSRCKIAIGGHDEDQNSSISVYRYDDSISPSLKSADSPNQH